MSLTHIFTNILDLLKKDNFRILYVCILLASIFCLVYAYIVEFMIHVKPCPLCVYQRFPYLYLIKLSATGLLLKKYDRTILILIMLTLIVGALLSGYHTGIERHIFETSSFCTSKIFMPPDLSVSEFKDIISDSPLANCAEVSYRLFGVSLTEYNLLFNIGLLICLLVLFFS